MRFLIRRLFTNSDGYAMAAVMAIMLASTAISLGAWAAASGDIPLAENDVDHKRALAAAEAGLADYLQRLGQDNEVWLKCTGLPAQANGQPAPVNQQFSGAGADPRVWRGMPTDTSAAYTIELLPRAPYTACTPNVDASMMDSSGMIRVRVTGRAGAPGKYVKRSLVATLRRNGFLDFLYFTEYETLDPVALTVATGGRPVKRCAPRDTCASDSLAAWADQDTTCRRYARDGRYSATNFYPGSEYVSGQWRTPNPAYRCAKIDFITGDVMNGPFHTNDTMAACGNPLFGRNRSGATNQPFDRIEFYDIDQTCTGQPNFGNNPVTRGANLQIMQLPQSNSQLRQTVLPQYLFTGRTTITLSGNTFSVNGGAAQALPSNGLMYIANGAGCPVWSPVSPYSTSPSQAGCGDVLLQGTYAKSLTIATERDILITGNVTATANSNALLGLIANNYVRVYHPVAQYPCTADTNESLPSGDRTIEAAILSLGHVFMLDNYQCGNRIGNLNVTGAIAQKYRGTVGMHSGGTVVTGYIKKYKYDDRLKFRSPPHFLAPVQSAWRVVRATEQVPAR
jgi:hypothetical protein